MVATLGFDGFVWTKLPEAILTNEVRLKGEPQGSGESAKQDSRKAGNRTSQSFIFHFLNSQSSFWSPAGRGPWTVRVNLGTIIMSLT
jgi:hypothetical protein